MRKRNTTLACTLMLLMSMFLIPADVGAQIKWQEDFNYPTGNLYGHGGWGKYGSNPNDPIQVVEQTLDYEGYPGGVKGKSVKLGAASSGEDLLVRFDPSEEGIKNGTMYYSALINVSEAPSGPVHVMALLARTFSSVVKDGTSPTELGRLYVNAGDDEGHYKLGVERGSTKAVLGCMLIQQAILKSQKLLMLCLTRHQQVAVYQHGDYKDLNCAKEQIIAQQHLLYLWDHCV